jgi:ATP-dependent helicase/nuclease subunit B
VVCKVRSERPRVYVEEAPVAEFLRWQAYKRSMATVVEEAVSVLQRMEAGGSVVTSNQRAARGLRRAFDRRMEEKGRSVWEPAEVLSWESWTASLWRGLLLDGHVRGMLLNRSQELAVWRAVIGEDASTTSELARGQMAELAMEAWRLLQAYGGGSRLRSYEGNTDMAAFGRWARAFARVCREEGYVSRAGVEEALRPEVEGGRARLPGDGLELVGFDEVLPARRMLLDAVGRMGVEVLVRPPERVEGERVLAAAEDEAGELQACALWIRAQLERRPEMRIGVIVPDLAGRREAIDRSFRRVLAPELESLVAPAEAGGPYEFSLGMSLGKTTAGATALILLRWAAGALPIEQVSALLLSPYLGGAGMSVERHARAAFDAFGMRRREMLQPEVGAAEILRLVRGSRWSGQVPGLIGALGGFVAVAERCGSGVPARYAEWAEVMGGLLEAVRWNEGGGGGSVAFQTVRKWESALDELGTLDFAGRAVGYLEALREMERIAEETIFAPESRGAAVQVMGPMEAAGSTFDAVWFLRAGDGTWPLRLGSDPLLPWALQRDLGMPGTSAGADGARGRMVTERVAASAATAIFSYARHAGEGRQRASAALEGLGLVGVETAVLVESKSEAERVELESVEDTERVPVPPDEVIRGGAAVLEMQAACGFRAFAQLRMGGSAPETKELGWDARKRGILVHRVLELFWGEVKTQGALLAMSMEERQGCLDRWIDEALREAGEGIVAGARAWDAAYVRLQRDRLRRLLGEWMEMEAQRSPFTVKLNEELLPDVTVGPLRLGVRVDRVDETEHGDVLIDYKTGVAKPSGWVGERPDSPQLPLYAILSAAERIEAVAFASVRAGKDMRLEGYAEHAGSLPKVVPHGLPDLGVQVEEWRRILTGLAEDFYNGDTRVNPKIYPGTCKLCQARILCRLDAAALEMDGDDEVEGDAEVG